jgi:hypothetical protein
MIRDPAVRPEHPDGNKLFDKRIDMGEHRCMNSTKLHALIRRMHVLPVWRQHQRPVARCRN